MSNPLSLPIRKPASPDGYAILLVEGSGPEAAILSTEFRPDWPQAVHHLQAVRARRACQAELHAGLQAHSASFTLRRPLRSEFADPDAFLAAHEAWMQEFRDHQQAFFACNGVAEEDYDAIRWFNPDLSVEIAPARRCGCCGTLQAEAVVGANGLVVCADCHDQPIEF